MLTKHIMTLHNYNRMQYCQHKVHWQSSEMQAESQTGGPPPFVACSVTVTEGVKKDTYGRCQCRSAQADRQEASACTSSPALTEPGERAALVVGQPHTRTASTRLLMRRNMPAKSHYSRDGVWYASFRVDGAGLSEDISNNPRVRCGFIFPGEN